MAKPNRRSTTQSSNLELTTKESNMNDNESVTGSSGTKMIAGLEAMRAEEEQAREKAMGFDLFSTELKDYLRSLLASGTPLSKATLQDVLQYVKDMAPGTPTTVEAGGSHQVRLYRSLVNYINNGPTDFRLFMGIFLRLVMELREGHVFNERYLMRFLPSMALPDNDRRGFQYLMNLFTTTANPATRIQALKQTDLNKAVSFGLTDVGQKRLISYYQV